VILPSRDNRRGAVPPDRAGRPRPAGLATTHSNGFDQARAGARAAGEGARPTPSCARPQAVLSLVLLSLAVAHAQVKRVVVIKVDGVPADTVERQLAERDPSTGKSRLPWIDHVFAQGGVRLANFYVRGISLSAPSWSMLDTGQHLQIRGNAEFDRYTLRVYDYLNFFPFYLGYAFSKRVDMPGVEELDALGIPLLIDRFQYPETYQGLQLYQRGVRWTTLRQSIERQFASRSLRGLLDEWTVGFDLGGGVEEQTERELIEKLRDPNVHYLDYFTGDFDHTAHLTANRTSQLRALQRIDALIGRVWTAIQASPLAGETVLAVVSDHGMNSAAGVYSQGFNLLEFFNSAAGGGHHVITNRHPLDQYKLKGLDPFVSEVTTASDESFYLKGEANDYPTVLLDPDGNERASVYLRNSDLNVLQILLQALAKPDLDKGVGRAASVAVMGVIAKHRGEWETKASELKEELGALRRQMRLLEDEIKLQPKKWTQAQNDAGLDKAARRKDAQLEGARSQEREYSGYLDSLAKLLAVKTEDLEKHRIPAAELIPRRAMGEKNTVHDLENYVVGTGPDGLATSGDRTLDWKRSFRRIDYFRLLHSLTVRNNVQRQVGPHPVDFVAMRIPKESLADAGDDAIWLYGDEDHQALILPRFDDSGALQLRYLPIRSLRQDADGAIHFETVEFQPGLPLRIWEDPQLRIDDDRTAWLAAWHPELDWLHAVHRTDYSDGIIGLHEEFDRHPPRKPRPPGDAGLLERYHERRRALAEADFLIFANDHWNFNVRGFNPGGNHGSLLRISTHSVLMFAGGAKTGIASNQVVEEPYDSLSFVPTILDLLDKPYDREALPGREIRELRQDPHNPAPAGR